MKFRTSLTLNDCGNFGAIKLQPETVKTLHIATLFGICSGTSERKSPDKTVVYHGLKGIFRVRVAADGETVESGQLYYPPDFNARLAAMVKKMQETPSVELTFCFDLVAARTNSDQGFAVNFIPRGDLALVNRMDDFIVVADKTKKK